MAFLDPSGIPLLVSNNQYKRLQSFPIWMLSHLTAAEFHPLNRQIVPHGATQEVTMLAMPNVFSSVDTVLLGTFRFVGLYKNVLYTTV